MSGGTRAHFTWKAIIVSATLPRLPRAPRDRADLGGFRLPPALIDGDEHVGLVREMAIKGLRRIAGAARDAVAVGAVEAGCVELRLRRIQERGQGCIRIAALPLRAPFHVIPQSLVLPLIGPQGTPRHPRCIRHSL